MKDKKENQIKPEEHNFQSDSDCSWAFIILYLILNGFGKDTRVDGLNIKVEKLETKLDTLIDLIK